MKVWQTWISQSAQPGMTAAMERHHLPCAVVQIGRAGLNDLLCRREGLTPLQQRGRLVLDLEWEQIAVVEVDKR